jgi:hypothetical protein
MVQKDSKQPNADDQERPNRESNMEPAEGSRDSGNSTLAGNQGGRGTSTMHRGSDLTEEAVGQNDEQGGGISNRPLDEEQGRQENLPPRGERRDNWKED